MSILKHRIVCVCLFVVLLTTLLVGCATNSSNITSTDNSGADELKEDIEPGTMTSTPREHEEANTAEYLIAYSDKNSIDISKVACMTPEQLELAYYEIYARHGVIFDFKILNGYFASKSWYSGKTAFSAFDYELLSTVEKENLATLEAWIEELRCRCDEENISVGDVIWCEEYTPLYHSNDTEKAICYLPQYSAVTFLGQEGNYIKVDWNGKTGYIFTAFTEMSYSYPDALYNTKWGTVISDDIELVTTFENDSVNEQIYCRIPLGERIRFLGETASASNDYCLVEYDGIVGYLRAVDIRTENFSHFGYPIGIISGEYLEDDYFNDILMHSPLPEDLKAISTELLREYPKDKNMYIDVLEAKYGVYRDIATEYEPGYNETSFSYYYNSYAPIVNEKDFNESVLNEIEKDNLEVLSGRKEIEGYFYADSNTWEGTFSSDSGQVLILSTYAIESKQLWLHRDSSNQLLDSGWIGIIVDPEHYKFATCNFYWLDSFYEITLELTSTDEIDVFANNEDDAWFVGHYKRDDYASTDFTETLTPQKIQEAQSGVISQDFWVGNYSGDAGYEMDISSADEHMFKCTISDGDKNCEEFWVVFNSGRETASCEVSTADGVFKLEFSFDGRQTIAISSTSGNCWMEGTYNKNNNG